ncbi:P2Y purinoceptor 14-like [Polymixia lowei]
MVFCSLVFLAGLVLNGFTMRVYFCRAHQHSSSVTVYLKNLAAADFLLCLCLPLRVAHYASHSPPVHWAYCHFGASAFYLNMYASILFMGYIAANRYLKIVHPFGTHVLQKVRAAHVISTATWVFLLSSMGVYITLSLLTLQPPTSVPGAVGCVPLHSQQLSLLYKIIHSGSAFIFFSVLVSLVLFYHSTTRRLMLAQRKRLRGATSGCKKLAKSRRNMLLLVSVFCVCFVPYHLVRLPYAFLRDRCAWGPAFFYLKELTIMLSILNICLDPLIYFIFSKAFRAQLGVKRAFSTTEVTTQVPAEGRRTSEGRLSFATAERETSLIMMRRTSVL